MILPLLVTLALNATDLTLVRNRRLDRNQTVTQALYDANLDQPTVEAVQGALKAVGFDFKRARSGDQLRFVFRDGQLDLLDYRRSALKEWLVRREGDRYVGRLREVEREQRIEVIELNVDSSIWDAAIAAGEKPEIAVTLSDVFAWDIDFYRDVQKGDRMRAVIEKVVSKGRTIEYGNVLAASYIGSSIGTKRTFRYPLLNGTESYFLEDELRLERRSSRLRSSSPMSPRASEGASTPSSNTSPPTMGSTTALPLALRCGQSQTARWFEPATTKAVATRSASNTCSASRLVTSICRRFW